MTDFDLTAFDAVDEATLAIKHPTTGEPTTWVWTFYGPGHPATVDLENRISRDALREIAAQKQARVNGKKWTEKEETIDQIRNENAKNIVARTKSFTPVKMGTETTTFTADVATAMLLDRRKSWLMAQIMEFLKAEENFIPPSETN